MEFKSFVSGPFYTNTYLVYDPETSDSFIIDPACAYQPLLEEIRHLKLDPKYIVLTHGHSDHTGGINFLKENFPDIKIIASRHERDFMQDRGASMSRFSYAADIETEDGQDFEIGSLKLHFIFTPGHTPGGQCILMGDTLFSGDTLFFASVGRTDLRGGDQEKLLSSIKEKLLVLPEDTKVLPGHSQATTISYEKRYNPFV